MKQRGIEMVDIEDLEDLIGEFEDNSFSDLDDIGKAETVMDAIASTLLDFGIVKRPKRKAGSGDEYSLEKVLELYVEKGLAPAEAPECVSSFLESIDSMFYDEILMEEWKDDSGVFTEHAELIENLKKLAKKIEKYKEK
jgi:hypothetical protein